MRSSPPLQILAPKAPSQQLVLDEAALGFLAWLENRFRDPRAQLLAARAARQRRIDAGDRSDLQFAPDTLPIRTADWRVAPAPADLQDRRVEITGPVDRKMVINALNSGACTFMADFEDACAPTWSNLIEGQRNLADAVRGTIEHRDPASGKVYRLNPKTAVLLARPRGLHLDEAHVRLAGQPISASLFDLGLYVWHNARALLARG